MISVNIKTNIMGIHYCSKKIESDYLLKISINFLKKNKVFKTNFNSVIVSWSKNREIVGNMRIKYINNDTCPYLKFIYTQTNDSGEKTDFNYKVGLTTTPCYFGGSRYWFVCPLITNNKPCGKRVGTLYKNGDYFGCRHCHNLTYRSKNEPRYYKSYSSLLIYTLSDKIKAIKLRTKRYYYNKQPTKGYKKIQKLYKKIQNLSHFI